MLMLLIYLLNVPKIWKHYLSSEEVEFINLFFLTMNYLFFFPSTLLYPSTSMREKKLTWELHINREKRKREWVLVFVIKHNTNTIPIQLPLLYSGLSAIKFCLLTKKCARKKSTDFSFSIVFLLWSAEYKRKVGERVIYLFDILCTFRRALSLLFYGL